MYIYYATQARALGLHTYRWIHFRDAKERYRTANGDTRWERDDETGADGLSSSPASSSCTSTDYEVDTYVLGSVYPWITSFLLFLGCLLPLMSCRSVFYSSIYKGLTLLFLFPICSLSLSLSLVSFFPLSLSLLLSRATAENSGRSPRRSSLYIGAAWRTKPEQIARSCVLYARFVTRIPSLLHPQADAYRFSAAFETCDLTPFVIRIEYRRNYIFLLSCRCCKQKL